MEIVKKIKRKIWRSTVIGEVIDCGKNIKETGGLVSGVKKTFMEDVQDDPIGCLVYEAGRQDGKEEGVSEASQKYEDKFAVQAQAFEKEKDDYEKIIQKQDDVINECTKIINELSES